MLFLDKKVRLAAVLLATGMLFCASCSKKEGALVTKNRVSQVFTEERMMMGDVELYHYDRHLSEAWNWDGKELYRIDYHDSPPYSEVFFYEGKQISSTIIPAYRIRNEFLYDGRKLERIDCYQRDTLLYSCQFRHNDGKMTAMDVVYYASLEGTPFQKKACSVLFSHVMGDVVGALVAEETVQTNVRRQKKGCKGNYVEHMEFVWDDDDVVVIRSRTDMEEYEISLQYDDKKNPYSQLFGSREMWDGVILGFRMLSEHNVVSATFPPRANEPQYVNYSYRYDGDYPVRRTVTYSYVAASRQDFEETTYSYTRVDEYAYGG